jgi:Glucodextranase, domain B
VPTNSLRAALLAGVLALLALIGGPVASASAEVESSQITSPTDPTNLLYDQTVETSESVVMTVAGTTTGEGEVDIRCYYMGQEKSEGSKLIAEKVKPLGHAFSVNVKAEKIYTFAPCVLRAVPAGDTNPQPPSLTSDPFKGPRIAASYFDVFTNELNTLGYDYELETNSLSGFLEIESVGDCGLDYSHLEAPATLEESASLFDCNAALYQEDDPPSGPATRSELQIDGANAYSPATANYVNQRINSELEGKKESKVIIPGAPQVTVTKSFDLATGTGTAHEVDPIVRCEPQSTVPPTATSCTSFAPTGVELERTWQTSDGNLVAAMTDNWRSTNGAAHALNALYDQETVDDSKAGGAYEFPGEGKFAPVTKGQLVTLPAGANAIYYKENATTPDSGDGAHPQGAIVYDTPPANGGPLGVYRSTAAGQGYNGFEMPYQGTIPASGSYTLRMTFVQAYALAEVQALTAAAISGYAPALTIATPASGSTVSSPSLTISGTATDTGVLSSLTVAGQAVSVGTGGAWSTSVTLSPGMQTITAVATDQAGLSTTRSISVTYTPPAPPAAKAAQIGSASGSGEKVKFTVACSGPAGTSCELQSLLSTVEKTRGGKLIAVSAKHAKTHTKQLTVGSAKSTIAAGHRATIVIALSNTGKRLLTKFKRLPVHLSVVLVSSGRRSTIIAQNLTLKPPRVLRRIGRRHGH